MTHKIKTFLTAFLCSLPWLIPAYAQEVKDFTFSHLGQSEGLCSQRIYSIVQTADGALWWSTKDGAERYNGVSVKHYRMGDLSTYSNHAGRITKLCLAAGSTLMAFDNKGGIFTYIAGRDSFERYSDVNKLLDGDVLVNDIMPTANGLWLAMREGIFFLHGNTLTPIVKGVYANTFVNTRHGLLLCTKDGVLGYDSDNGSIPRAGMQPKLLLSYNVESGYYDSQYDRIWLGGFLNGLRILAPGSDGSLADCELTGADIRNPVRSICPYDESTMLVGIDGLGVYKVSRKPAPHGKYESSLLFDANDGLQGVLHGNGVYAVLRDCWENIVVGSYSGGIDIARPVGSTPAMFQHISGNRQSLLNDHVNCVTQLPNGMMAMGTDNGVSLHNPYTKQWQHTCHGAVVLCLCPSPRGTMLAATYGQGVYEITENGTAHRLYYKGDGILQDDHVYKLFYDRQGNLWMGCLDGDLIEVSPTGNRHYAINNVQDIVQLPNGQIAVGTANGIRLISPDTGQVAELDYSAGFADVNKFIRTLYINNDKELWIGTDGGGIYVYSLADGQCLQVTTTDGLPSNAICSISKDSKGRMLIATEEGLAFAPQQSPKTVFCVNYCLGIEREYSARATVNLHNGHILYGTTSGALIVNPDNIQAINYTARLNILGIDGRELRLKYDERTFDLHYECINLRHQFDIVYQYKVGNGEWSAPTGQQQIRFTNLEPGTHRLLLRSVSRTCGTVLDEASLDIVIGQPWWNSWWMWVVYACLLLLAFYGAWRVYQLHTKYMRLVVLRVEGQGTTSTMAEGTNPLMEQHEEHSPECEPDTPTSGQDQEGSEFIDKVTKLVAGNLSDTNFNIDRLCREMAMSRTLFYIRLKTYTGKSPQDFIRIIRLERAATLLRSGRPVSETATLAGFDNAKYFSTVFKKYFGVSPSKYC